MDFSKLPKLSQTDTPPNASESTESSSAPPQVATLWCGCGSPVPVGSRFCPSCGKTFAGSAGRSSGGILSEDIHPGEIMIAGFLGALFMLMGLSFAKWSICKLTGQTYHTNVNWTAGPNEGTEVAYFDLQGMTAWTDTGIFLFGLSMVIEALALVLISRAIAPKLSAGAALLVTAAAFAINGYIAIKMFGANTLPLLSLLAMGFSGFTLMRLWQIQQMLGSKAVVANKN